MKWLGFVDILVNHNENSIDRPAIDRAVGETERRLRGSRHRGRKRVRVAVDATGLADGAVNTFSYDGYTIMGKNRCRGGTG